MSKISDYIIRMEEAATEMSRTEFIREYGTSNVNLWDEINGVELLQECEQ